MQPLSEGAVPLPSACHKCGAPLAPGEKACSTCGQVGPGEDPLIGHLIAEKYRVLSRIAIGGTSTIYRAVQEPIHREVALKIMNLGVTREPASAQRFKLEAEKASSINHPHAVTIFDFGDLKDGTLYLAMEYVRGKNLREILQAEGTIPEARVVRIMKQVCEVLSQAHRRGIIHRDLKPDNIMLEPERAGEADYVVVLDFGIAKTFGDALEHLTMTGNIVGTPHYMSPEQCEGKELDARSDIYSLGILMYEMLTGKVPFDSNSGSVIPILMMHVQERPRPLRAAKPDLRISSHLEKTVMRALAKERNWRHSDAADLLRNLRRCEGEAPATTAVQERAARAPVLLPALAGTGRERSAAPIRPPSLQLPASRRERARRTPLALQVGIGLVLVSCLIVLRSSSLSVEEKLEIPSDESQLPARASRIEELLQEGSRLQASGNPLGSMDLYGAVLDLDKGNPDGLWGLAVSSEKIGQPDQAAAFYGQFLEEAKRRGLARLEPQILMARNKLRDRTESSRLLEEATGLASSGKLPEAISAYRRYIEKRPMSAEAHEGLGLAFLEQKRYPDAFKALDRASQLDPENAEIQFNKGRTLYQLERFAEAAQAFDAALRQNPEFPNAAQSRDVAAARAKGR